MLNPESALFSRHTVLLTCCVLVACLSGCVSQAPDAQSFTQQTLLIDTHIDAPTRLLRDPVDLSKRVAGGEFDAARARAGGLDAAFMSVYIPASVDAADKGLELADRLIAEVEALARQHPDTFVMAYTPEDIKAAHEQGQFALLLGMENGGPLRTLADVDRYAAKGIRYVTLAHSKSNALSDSSYDLNEKWGGLSPYGEQVVQRMNELGVLIDVSHLSDKAFWAVLKLSRQPVIASHSSARHFTPGFQRNMSDEMIRALGEAGGVVHINFGSSFLTAQARQAADASAAALARHLTQNGIDRSDSAALSAFRASWRAENPYPFADLDDVLDHIDHVVALAGIEHVGIGSDYDGVGDSLPADLKDVAAFPNLTSGLRKRGYKDADIRKIYGENFMRVFGIVQTQAQEE